jgi:hypothetical protein
MVANSVKVVETADRTHEIPRDKDGALKRPDGMTDAEWNIHQDAMCSQKSVPVYLANHMRRVELAQKLAGDRTNDLPRLAKLVVRAVEERKYPTIDVTVKDKE